ncbi:MAG: thymidine phosphorylase [Bdellovibrionaceae bacterium]|nr:thymidine phosphorylase [Pseudobdellovibrionaceae bacterium]
MSYNPVELILKKKRGQAHTAEEISYLVNSFTQGGLPNYQMSAWLMAVCFKGLTDDEVSVFTQVMKESGITLNLNHLDFRIDKHSTGGVGDKTSLILGPIVAAAGVHVPMIAGRGLGHTGGTLDKLESLPGFNVWLKQKDFETQVSQHQLAIMGQTEDICPADKKIYALRDVTATVDSLPLICGSIMSKKLAENITGLVLDVKYGSGAFMKTLDQAEALANLLKTTGQKNGLEVVVVFSSMEQPLGRFIGNGLEVQECLDILNNKNFMDQGMDFYADTRDLSLILAGYMIYLGNRAKSPDQGLDIANEMLRSGRALKKFQEIAKRQGCTSLKPNISAKHKFAVVSNCNGVVSAMNCEEIGFSAIKLGAGRLQTTDLIDHSAGIEMNCRLGQKISKGQTIAFLYTNKAESLNEVSIEILNAIKINSTGGTVEVPPLIAKVI